jgi:hypothetical protein
MTRRHIFGASTARRTSPARRARSRESGYAFLMALFMILIAAAGTIVLLENLVTDGRRIREQQTIWRGEQYKRAIRLYYRKTGHFPQNVDDLIKGVPGVHFLREVYKDPMNTADGSWRFIYVNAAGQITGSVRYATLQQMVAVDQYLGLLPGAIPLGPQNAGIGVPAASLSSLGSSLGAQVAQAAQGGQISQSQISSLLSSIPGLPPGITPAQAQAFVQNMPADQLQSILQSLPPDQQAAANAALQTLQSQPPPDQSGQPDQNPPDPNNPQNSQNPQNPNQQQYSPNPDNSQNPPNNDNANNSQDTGAVIPLPATSNGLTASGQPINPLLLMKPTGPVDSPVFGGFLIGVGIPPNVDRKSVKFYRAGKKYNQWEFIWNPLEDALTNAQNGGSSGAPAQGGILGGQLPGGPPSGGPPSGGTTPSFGGGSTSPQPQQ